MINQHHFFFVVGVHSFNKIFILVQLPVYPHSHPNIVKGCYSYLFIITVSLNISEMNYMKFEMILLKIVPC